MQELVAKLESLSLEDSIRYLTENYKNVVFSTSFGQEDQVIADVISRNNVNIRVFTLDTGRLFQETYDLMDSTKTKYKKEFEIYFPNTASVEALVKEKGFNSFYFSIENRKECCFIRKIEPLKRALTGAEIWITGLRSEQSENRSDLKIVEWDESNKIIKFNPLIHWTYQQVLSYLKFNRVPDNPLHNKGFISIGCLPCTRAVQEGENPRAGRWSWETSKKECGLHR